MGSCYTLYLKIGQRQNNQVITFPSTFTLLQMPKKKQTALRFRFVFIYLSLLFHWTNFILIFFVKGTSLLCQKLAVGSCLGHHF